MNWVSIMCFISFSPLTFWGRCKYSHFTDKETTPRGSLWQRRYFKPTSVWLQNPCFFLLYLIFLFFFPLLLVLGVRNKATLSSTVAAQCCLTSAPEESHTTSLLRSSQNGNSENNTTALEAPSLMRRLGNGGKGYWRPVYNTVVKERPPKVSP